MTVLIDAADLARRHGSGERIVLLDVRWRLGDSRGREQYLAGHLPGAVYVDLEGELSAHGEPTDGRHPLPEPEALQSAARRWGLRTGDTVVVYDADGGLAAARAWWLLRWAGHQAVFLLDGGLGAWTGAGHELETGEVLPEPGDARLGAGAMPTLAMAAVAEAARSGLLLDARAPERYRGETEPVDPHAGHIPGAVNAPTAANLAGDGRFLPPEVLRERFAALGAGEGPVAVYCGSGVTAAHEIAALAVAGYEAALYPGSWSQWSNHEELPRATGPDPG